MTDVDRNIPNLVPTGVVVGLPGVLSTSSQSVIVEPSVNITSPSDVGVIDSRGQDWLLQRRPSMNLSGSDQPFVFYEEPLHPPRVNLSGGADFETIAPMLQGEAEPIFPSITSGLIYTENGTGTRLGEGLGIERLPFGLFDIDPAQPANNFRIRTVFADRMNLPDRASYFWAETRSPTGMPLGESFVDYQELRFRAELGSKKFSTAFEVPFRSSDPVLNENHAGLADLQLATKLVMLSGQNWLLTQFTGFRFPTGNSKAGLGTGQVGMEPGLLFRSKFRETTWLHGEAKFWFPLGGAPGHSGQVIKLATGLSTVWRETDRSALVPSLELSTFTVLDGRARDATQTARDIDGDFIFNVTPGVHYSVDQNGDFGLLDIGASISFALTNSKFAESMFVLESRWFW